MVSVTQFHSHRRRLQQGRRGTLPRITEAHQEPGCLLYANQEAPNGQIGMIEKWQSAALLDAHGEGEAVRRLNASLEGLLETPVEVTRLGAIPAGTESQGAL